MRHGLPLAPQEDMKNHALLFFVLVGGLTVGCTSAGPDADGSSESAVVTAPSAADGQQTVDRFLAENEPVSTKTYCRVDIPAPECRNLVEFKNKATGQPSQGFMIAFTAAFRQQGGAEFLLPSAGGYTRYGDKQFNGKVEVEETSVQEVDRSNGAIVIKKLKLGPVVADLRFDNAESVLDGERPSAANPATMERVRLVYKLFDAR
jgi:hypothetical protein